MYRYLVLTVVLLTGCVSITPYEREIQQGQQITTEQVNQIVVGMPLAELAELLGRPTLELSSNNRVDYVIERDGGAEILSIYHDGQAVTRID